MEDQNQPLYMKQMEEKVRLAREDFLENLRSLADPKASTKPAVSLQSAVEAAKGSINKRH